MTISVRIEGILYTAEKNLMLTRYIRHRIKKARRGFAGRVKGGIRSVQSVLSEEEVEVVEGEDFSSLGFSLLLERLV